MDSALECCSLANLAEVAQWSALAQVIEMDACVHSDSEPETEMLVDPEPPLCDEALAEPSPELAQHEAARALGILSANVEYGGETCRRAGVQLAHLTALLRSDDQHCQRVAATALCDLASNIGK